MQLFLTPRTTSVKNGIGRALILALAVLSMTVVSAQEPSFDVASVKVTASDEANPNRWARFRPGDVNTHASPLRWILPVAFGVPGDLARVKFDFTRVSRDLLERTYFDIQAKGSPTGDQAAMLRTLLRDRFGLKWHSETRTVPIYRLTVKQPGKLGPWLKASSVNCLEFFSKNVLTDQSAAVPPECRGISTRGRTIHQTRSAGTSEYLATRLQGLLLSDPLPIIDATGLKGTYSWDFLILQMPRRLSEFPATLRDALEDQLGLTLTRTTGPWEVIVIDRVQMPRPN